jgi:hypothetical protein
MGHGEVPNPIRPLIAFFATPAAFEVARSGSATTESVEEELCEARGIAVFRHSLGHDAAAGASEDQQVAAAKILTEDGGGLYPCGERERCAQYPVMSPSLKIAQTLRSSLRCSTSPHPAAEED